MIRDASQMRTGLTHLRCVADRGKVMSRVIAYHVLFSTDGFGLPNDPRGSNSTDVRADALKPFGPATKTDHDRSVAGKPHDRRLRFAAKKVLKYPVVEFTGRQALSVANGFAKQVATSGYAIYACCVLPQHAHLVIGRHRYDIEQVGRALKQAATTQLLEDGLHPFADMRESNGRLPSVWAQDFRHVFLFTPDDVFGRIDYVEKNPLKEGKRQQTWSFVTPYDPVRDASQMRA
jgi:REP element-mobilizing transposase RayT